MRTATAEVDPRLLIAGGWHLPDTTLTIVSPSTEELVGVVPVAKKKAAAEAVRAAREAFDEGPWPRMSFAERARHLATVREGFEARGEDLAIAVTTEIGVPITMSRGMVARALVLWDDHLRLADELTHERWHDLPGCRGRVRREPSGVVLSFPAWNGPAYNLSLKTAPPLLAGCSLVLKTVPETGISTQVFAEILADADLPPGVVNVVPAGPEVSEWLVRHESVDRVSFTGSTETGRRIMHSCADRIARITLELGGKSAAIVLDDVEPDAERVAAVASGVQNSGQVCSASTRLVLPRRNYEAWLEGLSDSLSSLRIGDPFDPTTDLGPVAHRRHFDRVTGWIQTAVAEGARVVTGGGRPAHLPRGYFIEPTLLDGNNRMEVARQEVFGPVLVAIPHGGPDDALRIANDSSYGLAATLFTDDEAASDAIVRDLRAGVIRVNGGALHPTLPFGGYKASGIGREGGQVGVESYQEVKAVAYPPS